MQNVFILGSKGIPAQYGGYETFVDKLTEYQTNREIQYHVACAVDSIKDEPETFIYHGAECFRIEWKKVGAARAIFYDIDALKYIIRYVKEKQIKNPIVYILACRIGPFVGRYVRRIHALGGKVYVNPDGHEWLRAKWSAPVRSYWKFSEKRMVKHADLLVCDSKNIEAYIQKEYGSYHPNTTFIAYGADTEASKLADSDRKFTDWLEEKELSDYGYYLVVGRFVPENNYETMIMEFMKSNTGKSFALITNVEEKFLNELKERTHFEKDSRIKFVGTVYDKELLKKIREHAFAYFHGHEVGGTNPSLLEALGSTRLNLLLGVGFNREVAEDAALYWSKEPGDLAALIGQAEALTSEEISKMEQKAKKRIAEYYSWEYITGLYEDLFTK